MTVDIGRGSDGAMLRFPGDSTIGLKVGTGGVKAVLTVTPVATTGSYAANDYIGTSASLLEVAGFAAAIGGTGSIKSIVALDKTGASIAGELWFFKAAITAPSNSSAWGVSTTDLANCVGVVPIPAASYNTSASASVATVILAGSGLHFKCGAATTSLWVAFVTKGAPAYTATGDITFLVTVVQD